MMKGRSVVVTMGPPILTLADLEDKLERTAHLALMVLGQIMHTDPQASTCVRAASVIMDAYTRSRANQDP